MKQAILLVLILTTPTFALAGWVAAAACEAGGHYNVYYRHADTNELAQEAAMKAGNQLTCGVIALTEKQCLAGAHDLHTGLLYFGEGETIKEAQEAAMSQVCTKGHKSSDCLFGFGNFIGYGCISGAHMDRHY